MEFPGQQAPRKSDTNASDKAQEPFRAPSISLPKGGGAIRGMGEKFAANPVTGTGSISVPIAASPGRAGFGPQLSLSYDSGAGNGPFGFGWSLSLPAITRKTDKGLPQYEDSTESDVFILSGAEDLVPVLVEENGIWKREVLPPRQVDGKSYRIQRLRPRIEGLFARIERWTNQSDASDSFWRSITKDNISTWYGKSAESRIADPADLSRIFSWLICESYDDKGNVIVYRYAAEDSANIDLSQIHERNRTESSRSAERYLKRIRYGNHVPYFPVLTENNLFPIPPGADADDGSLDWLFEVVLDYGEHDPDVPLPHEAGKQWPVRNDPFSAYRAGYEVRTYRLCERVLLFHHFPEEEGVGANCLVRSTDFTYSHEKTPTDRRNPIYSFLLSVTQSGYKRQVGGYLSKSLPPLEFTYTEPTIDQTIHDVDAESLENLPYGLDSINYKWVDLDGEGLSGILTEQAGGWFYKRNLSPTTIERVNEKIVAEARFAPVELVAQQPSLATLGAGPQLIDLAGDGQLDLAAFEGPTPGFFERTEDENWEQFTPFKSLPVIDWRNPNLKFIDLTGDGHADLLISEDEVFCWHASHAEAGFGPAQRVQKVLDEEKGPALVLADGTESVFLADLSGDGLTDLVRIRNGEVCYWPNLGYGRFGTKVTMDASPWFEAPDLFDAERIRLADIDGSGTTDIIYLASDGVHLYFNQSGNSWGEKRVLSQLPLASSALAITALDLLGNGTACLVWSSPLPGDASRVMRYVDLMGGQKPHLLVKSINNLGAETHVQYAPSTKFYLEDKLNGTPWITRLPFTVHVVERVETFDRVSGNRFVIRYAYHHGYFDGVEREFRGFGMVEQFDTEEFAVFSKSDVFPTGDNIDAASHVPPVHTKTWFHTGVYLGRGHVSDFLAGLLNGDDKGEYYREPGLTDARARELLLDDTVLPFGLTVEEEREACRALKGSMLRQEVYALDGTEKEQHPYTVTEQNFTIRRLQPKAGNRHAVFFAHSRESINYHYERNPTDPRITHALTLAADEFGNVLKSAAIGYGRRQPDATLEPRDQAKQTERLISYTENNVTNPVDTADDHRTPLPSESRTFELTGLVLPVGHSRFTFNEALNAGAGAAPIAYEQSPTTGVQQKRLIEHVRTLYRPHDLVGSLPLGELQSLALPFESYKLAFTSGLMAQVYGGRVTDAMLETEGRYVHSEGDTHWWIPSGRVFLSPDSMDASEQELAYAREHFFLPHRYRDPFHTDAVSTETFVTYDAHDLLMVETRDAIGNRVTVGERNAAGTLTVPANDYRVLQPRLIMDANRNRATAAFDALGMVVGTAVMGKPEENLGDSLDGFEADLIDTIVLDHFQNPLADPHAILKRATTRLAYDLFAYRRTKDQIKPQSAVVYTLTREVHAAEPDGAQSKVRHSFSYSDGLGREIQKKIQAEPGPVPKRNENGEIVVGANGQPEITPNDVSRRWVGSGWTVFNNKGKPVRQYEPFFTDTHRFEFDVRIGVSPILFYDPVERVVATLHPNHTWEKMVFDPWRQQNWDVNDTVLQADPAQDPDVGAFFRRLPDAEYLPTWHALRTNDALALTRWPDTDLNNKALRAAEKAAATKASAHANTPSVAHFDTLERTFLTVANNGKDTNGNDVLFETRVNLDIEGNQCEVTDALDRVVMRYDYDILGNRIHQASMEAGERWMLSDVTGQPLYAWDSRDHQFRTAYDPLRRPTDSSLRVGTGAEVVTGRTLYGESRPNAEASNLRGKVVQLFDQAGVVSSDEYDFKGNLLRGQRELAREYKTILDWSAAVPPSLEPALYTTGTRYDALNRPIELTAPDNSVIRPSYNEANLLERVEANVRGAQVVTPFVGDIDYNAKGQRVLIAYGNGVTTSYEYDPLTFRLVHLQTMRGAEPLQDLRYTFDPVGNITHIRDDAQQTIFFRNRRVEPSADYTYDAVYELIEATGREHLGQAGAQLNPPTTPDAFNAFHTRLNHPGDGNAMGTYVEQYFYDAVGNILAMQHRGTDPAHQGWARDYAYNEPSLVEPAKKSNRLSSTTVGSGAPEIYTYDAHGNMTSMAHLPVMQWDYRDELQATAQQAVNNGGTPETTRYVYDNSGQRVRKVTERQSAAGQTPTRMKERIYLGGFEIYREYENDGDTIKLERETLHIMDDKQRIALVETRTQGNDASPAQLIRYQFGNHLGSASLELDEQAQIISYEEYYPYGSTSYQAVRRQTETAKRYRYTGKERDEESGLCYHGARYYAPLLGRWVSCDPIGIEDAMNLYEYVRNNPQNSIDTTGNQTTTTSPVWEVKGGLKISAGSTGLEFRPFMEGSISVPIADRVGGETGAQLEFYTANPKYGIERGAVGGNFSLYTGGGLALWDTPEHIRMNSFDVRTFSGSGPAVFNLRAGYGLNFFFGHFVGVERPFHERGPTSPLYSRTGNIYAGVNVDSYSVIARYGNDNLPLGNKLDANETAFGSVQLKVREVQVEGGFFNVTDQIQHGSESEHDVRYKRITDPKGTRLAGGEIWDPERKLGTYLTEGPGVSLHVVYGAVFTGPLQLRLGTRGKWAHDVTQGGIHRSENELLGGGLHLFPHDSENFLYKELNLDLSHSWRPIEITKP